MHAQIDRVNPLDIVLSNEYSVAICSVDTFENEYLEVCQKLVQSPDPVTEIE